MEPLDQHIAEILADEIPLSALSGPARLLVVGTPLLAATVRGALHATTASRGHRCATVTSLEAARTAIARQRFDVVILSIELPDGDGLDLAPLLHKAAPACKIIVACEKVSATSAIDALRSGAIDLVSLPIDRQEFGRRIEAALGKSRIDRRRDQRLTRLTKICRELNNARQEITKQVDGLCSDLASAYQDIAEQMNDVALAAEFRTLLKQELDVEDLLRTTLEYLLTKTGPTNAAVFLPDSVDHYGLGAYVNYDCPRESITSLLEHLCGAICPQMAGEKEIVAFDDAADFAHWIGGESDDKAAAALADSQVVAFSCRDKKDCLAVFVLFRSSSNPFPEKLAGTLDTLRSIIGEQLSTVIKVHHRARPAWPREAADGDLDYNDDLGFGYEGGLAA